jgi:hypothetical protein
MILLSAVRGRHDGHKGEEESKPMDVKDTTAWKIGAGLTMWDRRNSPHLRRCFCSLGVVSSVPHPLSRIPKF